jgi:hypothetical protein
MTDPLLDAILNLSKFHRDHEKFYAREPRLHAVTRQRHARGQRFCGDYASRRLCTPHAGRHPYRCSYFGPVRFLLGLACQA